jgi:hypothetical protein
MKMRHYLKKTSGAGIELAMVDVTFPTNDFANESHPDLFKLVRQIVDGKIEEDVTLEQIEKIPDAYIKETWEKARWVAENAACLVAADHLTMWGCGYRSDDGFDYLTAAIDSARFLSDIDLSEEDFLKWWNHHAWDYAEGEQYSDSASGWGAVDGEIRFMMFPQRAEADWATSEEG